MVVDDPSALRVLFDEHLSKRRAFLPGEHDVNERAACELVLEHRGRSHRLAAEVVHVRREDPGRGVGLLLAPLEAAAASALRTFVEDAGAASEASAANEANDPAHDESEDPSASADSETADARESTGPQSLHERVRTMSGAEQLRLAANGSLSERTLLERLYGPTVWETLLRNARLTIPEVARIARKATLPRPLIELVAGNAPWLASGEVQRALLSNTRSSPTVIQKVLGAMSRHDLQMVPQQTAYPESVRSAAKKRLGR